MSRQYRGQSGPHSIHDARQHAWARLLLGPGAPVPRMRPHRGQLPDLPEITIRPRRLSLFVRIVRILTLRTILDATVSGGVVESVEAEPPARRTRPDRGPVTRDDTGARRDDSLAA